VTNTGTLKATTTGTLDLESLTVINSVGAANGTVTVDGGSTLTLTTATITGGIVTDNTSGTINLNGLAALTNGSLSNFGQINVNGASNALHNETIAANNMLEIMAGGALLVDLGSTIANSGGTVKVDGTGTLTLTGTTITAARHRQRYDHCDRDGRYYRRYRRDGNDQYLQPSPARDRWLGVRADRRRSFSGDTVFFQGSQDELILDHSNNSPG